MKNKTRVAPKDRRKARRATFEELRLAAYYHWQQRGSPRDDGLTDWFAAERRSEEEAERDWEEEERRWDEKDPRDEEPGEVP